jgi:hypothetical protein
MTLHLQIAFELELLRQGHDKLGLGSAVRGRGDSQDVGSPQGCGNCHTPRRRFRCPLRAPSTNESHSKSDEFLSISEVFDSLDFPMHIKEGVKIKGGTEEDLVLHCIQELPHGHVLR